MEQISVIDNYYKVGKVNNQITNDARTAGLSESGINAMINGDIKHFKYQLMLLETKNIGNIWACTTGYSLWFNSANESIRKSSYNQLTQRLGTYVCSH
ncbi:MAG: hypothetical protein KKH70_20395 [Gammaproteobacteria bacterium]|nr:hypothetical protein [Gammaproteobacteria bacterium]